MTGTTSTDFCKPLREAAEWRLIALLLARPSNGWAEHIAALKREVCDEQLRLAADAAPRATDDGWYDTVFGPGGPAAPREVSHRPCLDGNFLAELSALYSAFAYSHAADEPPDHVAVQADFVAYLRLKQAYAQARGADEQAAAAAHAAQRILDEHLRITACPLHESLARSGIDHLALAAAALRKRVGPSERQRVIIPVLDDSGDAECASGCENL